MSLEYQLMSNEEFLNYIPKETKLYINLCKKYYLKIKDASTVMLSDYVLSFLASTYALMNFNSKYRNFFEKNGFVINSYFEDLKKVKVEGFVKKINIKEKDSNDIISKFRISEEKFCDNTILTPIKIVNHLYYMCDEVSLKKYFYKYYDYGKFKDKLEELRDREENTIINEITNSYFNKKSSITEYYLCEVAYVYDLLFKAKVLKGLDKESYKTFALFAGLFRMRSSDEKIQVYQTVIRNYNIFKKNEINYENILEKKICINKNYYSSVTPILVLNKYFSEYKGIYTDISTIFKNVILSDTRGIIKRLFKLENTDLMDLYMQFKALDLHNNLLTRKEYNKELNPDVINYLENSYKLYKYIVSNNSTKDGIIIQRGKDYNILAMLLTSFDRNSSISKFFKLNNIDSNYICNLLNINLNDNKYKEISIDNEEILIKFYSLLLKIKSKVEIEDGLSLNIDVNYSDITIDNIEELLTDSSIIETRILNRIYNEVTGENLPDKWGELMKSKIKKYDMMEKDKQIEDFFNGYSIDIYKYLSEASIIFNNIKDKIKDDNDSAVVSLLLAVSKLDWYNENSVYKYMQTFGYNEEKVKDFFELKSNIYEGDINPFVIKEYYSKYICKDVDEVGKPRKIDIAPPSILNEVFNNLSFRIIRLFDSMGTDYNSFKDFSVGYYKYNEKIIKFDIMNIIKRLRDDDIFCYFNAALNFYKRIEYEDQAGHVFYIDNKNDIKYLSLLLAVLDSNNLYCNLFKKEGVTYNYICNKLNEKLNFKTSYDFPENQIEKEIYEIYKPFIKYLYNGTNLCKLEENKTKKDVGFIARRLFDDKLNDNKIIRKLIDDNMTYNCIFGEIYNEKLNENVLTPEKLEEQLNKQMEELYSLKIESLDAALNFILEGDNCLSQYSEYILMQVREINKSLNLDESLENIDELVDNIYNDTPVKQGMLSKLFSSKDINRELNHKVLDMLSDELKNESNTLSIQIKKYREIFKIIKKYIDSVYKYKDFSNYNLRLFEMKLSHIPEVDTTYSERLSYKQVIDGFSEKISGYERTIILMNTQLYQIYQAISNHVITYNALNISKNVIIPMISSGVLFKIGNISQRKAIALSNSLVGLFKTAIAQDVNGVKSNLKNLKVVDLPQGTIDDIINSFDSFIEEINNSKNDLLALTNNETSNKDVKVKKIGKKGSN